MKLSSRSSTKRKAGVFDIVVMLAIISVIGFCVWYFLLGPKMDIRVDGKQIKIRDSVQKLIDEGFVLCDVNGKIETNLTPLVAGKSVYKTVYYIGIPTYEGSSMADKTGLEVKIGNFGSTETKLSDCSFYSISYRPEYHEVQVSVLIAGENMKTDSIETWVDFFKKHHYPFSKQDLEDFTVGTSKLIFGKRGVYQFEGALNYESKADANDSLYYVYSFKSVTYTRNVDIEYKTK